MTSLYLCTVRNIDTDTVYVNVVFNRYAFISPSLTYRQCNESKYNTSCDAIFYYLHIIFLRAIVEFLAGSSQQICLPSRLQLSHRVNML